MRTHGNAGGIGAVGGGVTLDTSDRELQQYLFDLQGYLVLHNVLGAPELAELNRLIDAQRLPSPRERIRFGSAAGVHGPDHGFLNWGSRSVACWIMRQSCRFFAFGSETASGWTVSTGSACTRARPWGPCTRTTGPRRATPSPSRESAFSLPPTASTRGSRSWPGVLPTPARPTGILVHSRESQESLQAAAPDSRGPGKGLVCGHSRGTGGFGRLVLRGGDARNSPVEGRPRAPDSALQVLRLPDGLVAGAGASTSRRPAHPSAASAPDRAGRSPHVRSLALRRRTRRGAVERRSGVLPLTAPGTLLERNAKVEPSNGRA